MKILKPIGQFFVALLIVTNSTIAIASETIEQQLDILADKVFSNYEAGGVVLVRKGDQVIYRKAFGMADLENNVKMKPEMVMKIASNTKQFTAMAIMQLIDTGKLNLEDTIDEVIDGYPQAGAKVTIHQLLNQSSGIKNISRIEASRKARANDASVDKLIAFFSELPLEFPSGSQWQYSNSNYILLTKIIEVISGVSYEAYLKANIFDPLGMSNTRYGNRFPIIANRARGYQLKNGEVQNADYISMSQPQGAGALISTIDDMNIWDKALYTEKLVSKEMLKQAFVPVKLSGNKSFIYGFGWILPKIQGLSSIEHNGFINGFASNVVRIPSQQVYVVVITNAEYINPEDLASELAAIAADKPVQRIAANNSEISQLVGDYDFGNGMIRTISIENEQLYIQIKGRDKNHLNHSKSGRYYFDVGLNHVAFELNNDQMEMTYTHRYMGSTKAIKNSQAH